MFHLFTRTFLLTLFVITASYLQAQTYAGGKGDGYAKATLSIEVGQKEKETSAPSLELYPNPLPSKKQLHIRLPSDPSSASPAKLYCYNQWGQLTYQTPLYSNKTTISLPSSISKGLYYIHITTSQQIITHSLMIE